MLRSSSFSQAPTVGGGLGGGLEDEEGELSVGAAEVAQIVAVPFTSDAADKPKTFSSCGGKAER
jgi:hypothetical protein